MRKAQQLLTRMIGLALFTLPVCCLYAQSLPSKPHWTLSWSDEFNLPNGSTVDRTKWSPEVGGNGWGNHELEYYTGRRQNLQIKNGKLVIRRGGRNTRAPIR
jgi:hypothetical protein